MEPMSQPVHRFRSTLSGRQYSSFWQWRSWKVQVIGTTGEVVVDSVVNSVVTVEVDVVVLDDVVEEDEEG